MTHSQAQALIVGAGPTGLTMAIALTQQGISCRIVDKVMPRPLIESRALGTHSRTMEIFEHMGVLQPMLEQGRQVHSFSFYAEGKYLGRLTFDELDAPYPFLLMLPQSGTERILLSRLEELGVVVERPVEMTALKQTTDNVWVTLRDANGNEEEVETSYLVACDGGRSTVRKLLNLDFEGVKMQGQYLVDCQIDWEQERPGEDGYLYMNSKSMLVFGEMPGGLWRVIVSMQQDDPRMKPEKPTLELMQALMDEHPGINARLHDITWASAFYISSRMVQQFRQGRVFLAGDAAHIHSPVGGQGMNAGIQDAYNLSWKLALSLKGFGNEALLDSYHSERYPIIKQLLPATEVAEHALMLRQPIATDLRNHLLTFATHLGFVQSLGRRAIAGFTINYRHSSIVDEYEMPLLERLQTLFQSGSSPGIRDHFDFDRGATAGDRAPDAIGVVAKGKTQRLFEVWANDPRHQLLIFTGISVQPQRIQQLNRWVQQIKAQHGALIQPYLVTTQSISGNDLELIDTTGEMHCRYGAHFECLYLVRPDGYIGFRSQPVDLQPFQAFLTKLNLGKFQ
ncbi:MULTISPECIES: FAD-dependent monooxygenase [Nostocales]|uniref:FAD-binding domain-containing protein n=3 Tax=Nostocales TaxID=1161 RepID=A0A0C1QM61_9CYAN|nr:FAD-dependent monooxygenase [Tolypothrix bouteillei]KAF3890079.1 hypothetical protein DA73_0400034955 [Tolypothrix bouteillei VB521301]